MSVRVRIGVSFLHIHAHTHTHTNSQPPREMISIYIYMSSRTHPRVCRFYFRNEAKAMRNVRHFVFGDELQNGTRVRSFSERFNIRNTEQNSTQ